MPLLAISQSLCCCFVALSCDVLSCDVLNLLSCDLLSGLSRDVLSVLNRDVLNRSDSARLSVIIPAL